MKKHKFTFTWKVIIVFSFVLTCYHSITTNFKGEKITIVNNNYSVKDTLYDYTINNIKSVEGLSLKAYSCPANQLTIGYGHKILKGEKFVRFDIDQATSLLRYDFDKCYNLTDTLLPYNKRLAIAHFIYCLGYGNYMKSTFRQNILNNEYIGNNLLRFVKYKKDGKFVSSKRLYDARIFELKLYYL